MSLRDSSAAIRTLCPKDKPCAELSTKSRISKVTEVMFCGGTLNLLELALGGLA